MTSKIKPHFMNILPVVFTWSC